MSEEGGDAGATQNHQQGDGRGHKIPTAIHIPNDKQSNNSTVVEDFPISPRGATTPNPFSRKNTSVDIDDYFSGPRDILKHSKWPLFMQMHGSILPKMIAPLIIVAAWATAITVVSEMIDTVDLSVNSILLTITGFVVGMGLSFRSSTAYERYAEGRRYWGLLTQTCQSLGRVFWIHCKEREGCEKKDMLAKLTALNLLIAYAISLKHKLRFEPYTYYDDLSDLIDHLDTFAKAASHENVFKPKPAGFFKSIGEHLGISFATSNPRKAVKKAQEPLGNLPLEILTYLSAYVDEIVGNGQLPIPMTQTLAYNGLGSLNDVMVNTERVLTTPLPIAYGIAIAQITWVYVFLLPFQLLASLHWITIPATVAASYIILGLLMIGAEIENPFGNDVNDLPLELYCQQIVQDIETISSRPRPQMSEYVESPMNKLMFPYSESPYPIWASRSPAAIRQALRNRPYNGFVAATADLAAAKKGGSAV